MWSLRCLIHLKTNTSKYFGIDFVSAGVLKTKDSKTTMKTIQCTKFLLIFFIFSCLTPTSKASEKPLKDFQLSIIPFVGTEGTSVIDYRYRLSVNFFAGATGGIEGFEAGGFLNITNGYLQGIQLAGFGNLVSGDIQGLQASGFANVGGGDRLGFAASGFANITGGNHQGFAGAGFANVVGRNHTGFSAAGFANVTGGSYMGFAGAGFANVAGGSYTGFAGAGFANVTGENHTGFSAAGFANISGGHVEGLQISGFLNIARSLQGLQLGFINVADTITDGVAIGFLSIVRKGGLRQVEIAASDVSPFSASFRIGLPKFYNIFSYNMRPWGDETFYTLGYGVGSHIKMDQDLSLQIEFHSMAFHKDWVLHWNQDKDKLDILNEGRFMLSYNPRAHFELFGGLVIYNQLYSENEAKGITGKDIAPSYVFHEGQWGDYQSRWWPGARAGIRFIIR